MLDYKDIPIRAAAGLHEQCFEITQRSLSSDGRVLDIAAGAGAFTKRLLEAGYEVVANDIDVDSWSLNNAEKYSFDLNKPLDYSLFGPKFDLVVAMEVIEHLQNPTKLLEDCKQLVKQEGYILLSTPNIMDMDSRVLFLRKGVFYHFSPQSYYGTGHRTILPQWLLELLFTEVGLEVIEKRLGGFHPKHFQRWNIKSWVAAALTFILRPFMKKQCPTELDSNYLIYLLRPPKND